VERKEKHLNLKSLKDGVMKKPVNYCYI